jgi:adenosylmethionine-8-amino-7-oxononanoate aminotransferase
VSEVRGLGYFYALELVADRDAGRPLSDSQRAALEGGELTRFLRDAKVLIRPDDRGATMLTVSPPLIADDEVLDDLTDRLDTALDMVDAWLAANS